jgi:multiple antibiotic resistance protein
LIARRGRRRLEQLEISLDSFNISGGIILFRLALTMIFGQSGGSGRRSARRPDWDAALFPLGLPTTAG